MSHSHATRLKSVTPVALAVLVASVAVVAAVTTVSVVVVAVAVVVAAVVARDVAVVVSSTVTRAPVAKTRRSRCARAGVVLMELAPRSRNRVLRLSLIHI